jgi:hypothetical protein
MAGIALPKARVFCNQSQRQSSISPHVQQDARATPIQALEDKIELSPTNDCMVDRIAMLPAAPPLELPAVP